MTTTALLTTDMPDLTLVNRGKVRDVYQVDGERLLIVASDRISAFDVVLPNGIPDKGKVLTQMSLFWFSRLSGIVPNHLITANVDEYPPVLQQYREQLVGRSMLVKRVQMQPIECVVRGYLSGSAWKAYQASSTICGIRLPPALRESERLPFPIFTPSTKAEVGHDLNIDIDHVVEIVGEPDAIRMREYSVALYLAAAKYAQTRGIIISDTKFEFGLDEQENLVLADEVLTSDSSRFWDAQAFHAGRAQDSFDKQFVRDYLETIGWKKEPPAPELPEPVVAITREKYLDAYQRLTGEELAV